MEKPKIKALFMLLCLLLASLPATAQTFTIDDIKYTVLDADARTCELTDGQSASGDLTILSTVSYESVDYAVTSIGKSAFYSCKSLTSVEIPNSVTSIGDLAFCGCSSLTSVEIPNSVTSIGKEAFFSCDSLTSVEIPNSVTSIGEWAFAACRNLTSVVIPNSVTSIGKEAFFSCDSLTSVEIPASVTSIGEEAFAYCNNLGSVYYLAVKPISGDKNIFSNKTYQNATLYVSPQGYENAKTINPWRYFTKIETVRDPIVYKIIDAENFLCEVSDGTKATGDVVIPSTVIIDSQEYTVVSIGENAFSFCSSLTSVEIPNSVTSIGTRAFNDCDGLTSVKIPKYVTSIGSYAFSNCDNLKDIIVDRYNSAYSSVDGVLFNREQSTLICCPGGYTGKYFIPYCVTLVDIGAFSGCKNMTYVKIPYSVTSISTSTFSGCSGLTSVEIPNSVTSIGNYAFSGCSSLTSVDIPNSVTSIGNYTFLNCGSLTSVEISASVTSIGVRVFCMCENLKDIIVDSNNPAYSSVNGVLFNREKTTLICCPGGFTGEYIIPNTVTSIGTYAFEGCTGLTSVEIPNSVTSIGNNAFSGCSSLTSVEIPNSVTSIGQQAFNGCSSLTSVEIPNSVTSIGNWAFSGCSSLPSVVIPKTVTSIGYYAFSHCDNLETVYYLAADPIEGSWYIFSNGTYQNATLYVSPQGYAKARTIDPWRIFDNIEVRETEGIADAVADDADTELYDLNGRRVDNPASGIYIRRRGTTTEKVIIK